MGLGVVPDNMTFINNPLHHPFPAGNPVAPQKKVALTPYSARNRGLPGYGGIRVVKVKATFLWLAAAKKDPPGCLALRQDVPNIRTGGIKTCCGLGIGWAAEAVAVFAVFTIFWLPGVLAAGTWLPGVKNPASGNYGQQPPRLVLYRSASFASVSPGLTR